MITQENADLAVQIMQEAMEVNVNTMHHAFVCYDPNVNAITVRVYKNGWAESKTPIYITDMGIGLAFNHANAQEETTRVINKLAELAKDVPVEFEEDEIDVATRGVDYPATL